MSQKVERVLFPIELVELTREIIPWVELMAGRLEAELHVLHVIPDPDYWSASYAMSPSRFDDKQGLISSVEKEVADFCDRNISKELPTRVHVEIGDPLDKILDFIESESISMVILGTHARRGLGRLFLGSVAERVIKTSPVPVISVNPRTANEGE